MSIHVGSPVVTSHFKYDSPQKVLLTANDNGVKWFEGCGLPPDLIIGASLGDYYHDTSTGNYYRLKAGA